MGMTFLCSALNCKEFLFSDAFTHLRRLTDIRVWTKATLTEPSNSDGASSVSPNHDSLVFFLQKRKHAFNVSQRRRSMVLLYQLGSMNALNIHKKRNERILKVERYLPFLCYLSLAIHHERTLMLNIH